MEVDNKGPLQGELMNEQTRLLTKKGLAREPLSMLSNVIQTHQMSQPTRKRHGKKDQFLAENPARPGKLILHNQDLLLHEWIYVIKMPKVFVNIIT